MIQSTLRFVACCALLTNTAAYGPVGNVAGLSNTDRFTSSAFGSGSVSATSGLAGTLAGLSQDQIDGQLSNLRNGDMISINNVRYVALRSENGAGIPGRANTMILVEAQRQSGNQDSYSVTESRIRDNILANLNGQNDGYVSDAGQGSVSGLRQNVIGFGSSVSSSSSSSSYSASPTPLIVNRQNPVATVNSVTGVNDPSTLSYSTSPADVGRQSVAGPDRSSYSSAPSNIRNRPQNRDQHDDNWDYSQSIPGVAGQDYPILSSVAGASLSSFNCNGRREGGYYADVDSGCQVYHVCALNKKFSFLCPNGTIFDQAVFVCNWWYNVDCSSSANYYNLNDQIGVVRPSSINLLPQLQPVLADKPIKPAYGQPQASVVQSQSTINGPFQLPTLASSAY